MYCGHPERDVSGPDCSGKGLESVIDTETVSEKGGQTALPKGHEDVTIHAGSLRQDYTQGGDFSETQILRLPLEGSGVAEQFACFPHETIELPLKLTQALKIFGECEQATLFITMLAAFQVLLARYINQQDVAAGSRSAGFDFSLYGDPTFREVVQRVREIIPDAAKEGDLAWESDVEALTCRRDLSPTPFVHVRFKLLKVPSIQSHESVDTNCGQRLGRADLSMVLFDGEDGARGSLSYDANLFRNEIVRGMVDHYRILLEGIGSNADARISELPLLSTQEREQLLVEWNNTCRNYPTDIFLHQFVERQVECSPNAVAAECENQALTYRQLNGRANQLAYRLQKLGVGPDSIVGILAERSFEMLIAILATLKAGGAYLPLEPTYPRERLAFLLEDSNPTAILMQRRFAHRLAWDLKKTVFLEKDFRQESDANPSSGVGPENLAYIIYTSGSTGKPKGVRNSHGGLSNWLSWMQEIFFMSEQDAMLQKSPFTFDVSVREFFLPLSRGAKVVIARPGFQGDCRYLIEIIQKHSITAIHFVPPMLSAFLEHPEVRNCTSLRLVMCSGDALTFDLRDRFFATFPKLELHNMWGATEHAPESTYYKCGSESGKGIVPVGRPGGNTQLYILDRKMQPVPIGVIGEAYLGGIQTALGYLRRPELTAEKFLPNPFTKGTLYKTGDLGRFRSDGVMEFVGRVDQQVKLRGFRLELEEIEAVLRKHPMVRDCVTVVRGDREESKRLVSYVVADGANAGELREHATRSLPDYMVPMTYVFLRKIPLTSNGKLDRRGLPEPEDQRKPFIEPQTPLEHRLAEIWREVLRIERVGRDDNFFELGGDSLSAVRIFLEIERTIGETLPLATLFEAPTVGKLADALGQGWAPNWPTLVPIQSRGSRTPFFGVHGGDGHVLFFTLLTRILGSDQPFYGLQSQGLDGRQTRHKSVPEIATNYVEDLRRVQTHGPYLLGGYSFGGVVAFEMARRLRARGEQIALLVLFDAPNPARPPRRYTRFERLKHWFDKTSNLSFDERLKYFLRRVSLRTRTSLGEGGKELQKIFFGTRTKGPDRLPADWRATQIRQAHARMLRAYRPRPYEGRITLFRAKNPTGNYEFPPDLGWTDLSRGGIEIHDIPGSHELMFRDPSVYVVAEKLDCCIRAALASATPT
jgi:amino acid adenylation domain-containing protein